MPTKREWLNIIIFALSIFFYHLQEKLGQLKWGMLGLPLLIIAIVMYIYGLVKHKDDWMKRYQTKKMSSEQRQHGSRKKDSSQ